MEFEVTVDLGRYSDGWRYSTTRKAYSPQCHHFEKAASAVERVAFHFKYINNVIHDSRAYPVSGQIPITQSNVKIMGAGAGVSVIQSARPPALLENLKITASHRTDFRRFRVAF